MLRANPPIWAQWEYDPTEWAAFDAWEWQEAKHEAWRALRLGGAIALIALVVCAAVSVYSRDLNWLLIAAVPLGVFGGGGLLNWGARYFPARRLHAARQRNSPAVTITPIGITQAGTYMPLVEQQLVLRRVWMSHQTGLVLHFHLTYYARGAAQYEIRVPVPGARAEEAAQLVARFQRQVI